MNKKIAVFLANGFEEVEALATVDVLRRAGLPVVTAAAGGAKTLQVIGAHNIPVTADVFAKDLDAAEAVHIPLVNIRHIVDARILSVAMCDCRLMTLNFDGKDIASIQVRSRFKINGNLLFPGAIVDKVRGKSRIRGRCGGFNRFGLRS